MTAHQSTLTIIAAMMVVVAIAQVIVAEVMVGGVGEETKMIDGNTSDGYHTFNELYEHRHALFLALMLCNHLRAWRSYLHHDGTSFDGYFIAGMDLISGQVSYHIPLRLWDKLNDSNIATLTFAPEWDGHTSDDVIDRIYDHFLPL